jgi:A/G-specific adenine glycosylase
LTDAATLIDPDAVLAWGTPRLRDLPWRATRDPWLVLVAEVMLQQTQAHRVVPVWQAFGATYPTPAECGAAPLGDVLRAWQGLGYPRRARDLRDAAVRIVERHGGRVPEELVDLLALPGVGPYTARAVLAFAFERDVAVVETNIARVLARTAGRRLTGRSVQAAADALVPRGDGWVWNQVLMDVGATVCRPAPRCDECPVACSCCWHRAGNTSPDPADGSAGVTTTQAPYVGSDRQARGAVLRVLLDGAHPAEQFPPRIVAGLVADRLVVRSGDTIDLP